MTIGIILGILFALLCIGAFVGGGFCVRAKQRGDAAVLKKRSILLFAAGAVFFVLFVLIPFSFRTVEAGEVAVVKHMGEARRIRTAGTYFDFWITEKYEIYDAKVQNMDISTAAYSKDAQTMDISMTVQYQIDTTKAIEIANRYGTLSTLSNRILSVSIEKAKSTLSAYSAMTIIETRASISPEVEKAIKESVDENYYVNIEAVVLTNIDFSDAFEQTVEDKMIAEQEKLKAEYEKETAIVNAEKELEVAKLSAEARIESAKADAQAQIEVARAEAQAIRLKSVEVARALGFTVTEEVVTGEDESQNVEYTIDFTDKTPEEIALITEYLKYVEYLSKWDGKLPSTVITDGSASVILPLPDGGAESGAEGGTGSGN